MEHCYKTIAGNTTIHATLPHQIDAPCESGNHDAQATSSELLDLLLQEDGRLGTGSNASGSGFGVAGSLSSGSNGASTSHTGMHRYTLVQHKHTHTHIPLEC